MDNEKYSGYEKDVNITVYIVIGIYLILFLVSMLFYLFDNDVYIQKISVRFNPQDDAVQNIESNISNNSTPESNEIDNDINKLLESQPDIVCPGETCQNFLLEAKNYMNNKIFEFNRNMFGLTFVIFIVYIVYDRYIRSEKETTNVDKEGFTISDPVNLANKKFLHAIFIAFFGIYIFYITIRMAFTEDYPIDDLKEYKNDINSLQGYKIEILKINDGYKYTFILVGFISLVVGVPITKKWLDTDSDLFPEFVNV